MTTHRPSDELTLAAQVTRASGKPEGLAMLLEHYALCVGWARDWSALTRSRPVREFVETIMHDAPDPEETT